MTFFFPALDDVRIDLLLGVGFQSVVAFLAVPVLFLEACDCVPQNILVLLVAVDNGLDIVIAFTQVSEGSIDLASLGHQALVLVRESADSLDIVFPGGLGLCDDGCHRLIVLVDDFLHVLFGEREHNKY